MFACEHIEICFDRNRTRTLEVCANTRHDVDCWLPGIRWQQFCKVYGLGTSDPNLRQNRQNLRYPILHFAGGFGRRVQLETSKEHIFAILVTTSIEGQEFILVIAIVVSIESERSPFNVH